MEVVILPKSAPERVLKLGTFDVRTEKPSKSLSKPPPLLKKPSKSPSKPPQPLKTKISHPPNPNENHPHLLKIPNFKILLHHDCHNLLKNTSCSKTTPTSTHPVKTRQFQLLENLKGNVYI